jgi:hypothetical protein
MKLLPQPRLLDSKAGHAWLSFGFRLFHKQPLAWTLILFIYWAAMLMLAFIPGLGVLIPLLLTPGLAFGFIAVAHSMDTKGTAAPPLLISGFRSEHAKPLLMLGVWYVIEILAIMLVATLIDGGLLIEWITMGAVPTEEQANTMRLSASVSVLLYIPVLMAFWFAPQLVVWSGFAPLKALFFSFFAVWRNKAAFLRYTISWAGLTIMIGALMSLLNIGLKVDPNTMTAFLFPITLILMAVAHSSFYASTKAVFGEDESTPSA